MGKMMYSYQMVKNGESLLAGAYTPKEMTVTT